MSIINESVLVYITMMMMMIQQYGQASDTMLPCQELSVDETLISASQISELGFFSPVNCSRRYLGVWFKSLPQTILWVANRDNPLSASDDSARLTLSSDGNLVILDGNSNTVWSTNLSISVQLNSSIAVLSDAGNLNVMDKTSGRVTWESFAHPCDIYMTSMKFEMNTKIGESRETLFWSSWRSETDPAVGNFAAGFLPQMPMQAFISNGEAMYWRSGPWNGLRFVGHIDTNYLLLDNSPWPFIQNKETGIVYFGDSQFATRIPRLAKIFHDGSLNTMDWIGNKWTVTWEAITTPCDFYGTCGPFGVCNPNESPICGCLRGFVPKSVEEWSRGNWTHGCVRRTELLCSKNMSANLNSVIEKIDGFWKLSRMKVPDNYVYFSSVDLPGCQKECLGNCSCTAYAYVDGIGCLLWTSDLIDVQKLSSSGEDLFIRLDHSELGESKRAIIMIFLVIGLFFSFILGFLITIVVRKVRRKWTKGKLKPIFLGSSSDDQQLLNWKTILQGELTTFDFEDIFTATNGFSLSNKLGEGGFGAVFRGKLHDGQEIAVKRLSRLSGQGVNEFLNEVLLISKLQHRNLVKIFGCSIKGEEKLIVYEYLPNRSLDAFLFDSSKKNKLDWATRFNIIQGIARGISYLHRDSRLKVIHRDLKASNVLLDDDMNPKISDFGLARAFQGAQESANTQCVVGTYGYMSPEYALRGIFSEKSDVFSFGVLVLEIISGNKTSSFESSDVEALGLLRHTWRLWKEGREVELIVESLANLQSDEVVRCIQVGLLCVQDRADDRPTMPAVIVMLSSDMSIPHPKQPLFVPESPSLNARIPLERNKMCSANVVTESLVQGR